MFKTYKITIQLIRDMLGTNPCDPNVMDTHIIDKQRKMILEKNSINSQINKYLGELEISKEKGDAEVNKVIEKLEELTGTKFTPEERELAIAGKLDSLKQTFKELDIKGTTIFFWDGEKNLPCIGDHMIYGFLKAAAEALSRTMPKKNGVIMRSCAHTQKIINQHVQCPDAFITFDKDIKRKEDGSPEYLQRSLRASTPQGQRISLAKSEVVPAGAKLEFELMVLKDSEMELGILKQLFGYGQMKGLGQWRNTGNGRFKVLEIVGK